jgi:hypothetical protein
MIPHTRRAAVLVAFSLLASAATASAECAWVLWAHWGGGLVRRQDGSVHNPYEWQVVEAFQSRDLGPLGYADGDGKIVYYHTPVKQHTVATEFDVRAMQSLPFSPAPIRHARGHRTAASTACRGA